MEKILGNAPKYLPESVIPVKDSPLAGRNVCFLGSSVTEGSASEGNSMVEYLGARLSFHAVKEAVSGTMLVDELPDSYIRRMKERLDPAQRFDLFVCQLSTNDAANAKPLGTISPHSDGSFDTRTVVGAIEYIIWYVQKHWGCPVLFYTGSHFESSSYDAMVRALLSLREKWGIGVIDLWNHTAFNDIPAEKRALYMADDVHPTMAGYRDWWCPEMERQMIREWAFFSNQRFI